MRGLQRVVIEMMGTGSREIGQVVVVVVGDSRNAIKTARPSSTIVATPTCQVAGGATKEPIPVRGNVGLARVLVVVEIEEVEVEDLRAEVEGAIEEQLGTKAWTTFRRAISTVPMKRGLGLAKW